MMIGYILAKMDGPVFNRHSSSLCPQVSSNSFLYLLQKLFKLLLKMDAQTSLYCLDDFIIVAQSTQRVECTKVILSQTWDDMGVP